MALGLLKGTHYC